jgi:hypothetical protein
VPGNPQNAGFCTIYPTASGPDLRPNFFRLASVSVLHLLFQNSLLLLKVLKALVSDRHKKQKLGKGPSNDHSWVVWFQLAKWFQRRSVLKHLSHRVQC